VPAWEQAWLDTENEQPLGLREGQLVAAGLGKYGVDSDDQLRYCSTSRISSISLSLYLNISP